MVIQRGGKKDRLGKESFAAGKPRKKPHLVEAADACWCNGNFQRLKGGEEVGAEGDGKEKERASE